MTTISQNSRKGLKALEAVKDFKDSISDDAKDRAAAGSLLSDLDKTISEIREIINRISGVEPAVIRQELSSEADKKSSAQTQRFDAYDECKQ